jgi:hypothetical protein
LSGSSRGKPLSMTKRWHHHFNGECGALRSSALEGYYLLHKGEWFVSVFSAAHKWERTVHRTLDSREQAIAVLEETFQ